MNGPFYVSDYGNRVCDNDGNRIAEGCGEDDATESKHAQMVCDSLNAAYYLAQAQKGGES